MTGIHRSHRIIFRASNARWREFRLFAGLILAVFAALATAWRQPQPRDEVFLGGPAAHVDANLRDELERCVGADSRQLDQVDSPAQGG